jgi:hypothetical protein
VEEVNMEEGILMTRREYFVLKEKKEEDRCGWSEDLVRSSETKDPKGLRKRKSRFLQAL